jgi:coproporphyrinogen III oxidase-like Fe-S oxidoreductase
MSQLAQTNQFRDLLGQVDEWIFEQDLAQRTRKELNRTEKPPWYWVDVYPRWRPAPPSDPEQMLNDWRAQEWKRIEFLYLNLPFCVQRCHFCYYFISTDLSHSNDYLTALHRELRAFLASLPGDATVGDLFFGGGTPSMMSAPELQGLYDDIYGYLDRSRFGMVTLELHPRTMRRDLHRLAASGHIDRVSMGVQTFSHDVLEQNGRIWVGPERVHKICTEFRAAGVRHIGLDFMVGLHTESAETVLGDLEHIADLARAGLIDSVSVYPRSFTEIWGLFEGESLTDEILVEKFRASMLYRRFFAELGWTEGPMYLFTAPQYAPAVPSALSNTASTAQSLAFGNSARCTFGDTNYLNTRSPDDYRTTMAGHAGSTSAHQYISPPERNRRYLHFGVKRGFFDDAAFPVPPTAAQRAELDVVTADLVRRDLVLRNGDRVELTEIGMVLVDAVHQAYEDTFAESGA